MIKIGELSKITKVPIQTIRFYESEGLLCPVEVDQWTNYRYYDETSIKKLSEILYLKNLGFSLKEIKNFSKEVIKEKLKKVKLDIKKLTENINKISSITKIEGGFNMQSFVNDPQIVGKWKKIAVVKDKNDFFTKKYYEEDDIFDFKELYFLPNGQQYWVFSWIKNTLFLTTGIEKRTMPYEIINDKLFVSVVDEKTNTIDFYAVYEKIANKEYSIDEIRIRDNTSIPFVKDEKVVGFWQTVDVVKDIKQFNPNKKFWPNAPFLTEYIFKPDGTLLISTKNDEFMPRDYSKDVIIDKYNETVSKYVIKEINKNYYMFVEWKSGDYVFGGKINCYYVLKKIK